jgi:predicted RNase H-like nuclease (RuvC/YqgF family)
MTDERCPSCDGWACDNECLPYWIAIRAEHDELRAQLDTLKLYAQRTTSQLQTAEAELDASSRAVHERDVSIRILRAELRDEQRENEALRRRLRVGGR